MWVKSRLERRRLRRTQSFDRIGAATTYPPPIGAAKRLATRGVALGIFAFSARPTRPSAVSALRAPAVQLDSVEVTPFMVVANKMSLEIAH